ncbi:MAG: HAMP domain-containing histidine kinase [Clostridia bacterium]|nr:HAMP domain-containing histidine kinase [Clostridia bacterium]
MDTKLKKSKLNPLIKGVILILTLIFAFLSGTSALNLVRKTFYFNNETENIKNTPIFIKNIQNELDFLSWEVGSTLENFGQNMTFDDFSKITSNAKDLKESYESQLKDALYYYNQIQEHKKVQPLPDGTSYDSEMSTFYIENGEYTEEYGSLEAFQNELSHFPYFNSNKVSSNQTTVTNENSSQEDLTSPVTTFVVENPDTEYVPHNKYNTRAEWEYDYANLRRRLFEIVNDARSEETIKKELEIKYNEQLVSYYETSQENLYNLRGNFNNIDFLVVNNKNGNYLSNFEKIEDIENLKQNYKDNALFYFYYDGKNLNYTPVKVESEENFINMILVNSGLISETLSTGLILHHFNDCTVYFKVNMPQSADDEFYVLSQMFNDSLKQDPLSLKTQTIIFSILTVAGIITLAILSKPKFKNEKLCLNISQRTFFIIHLALYFAIIFSIGLSIIYLVGEFDYFPDNSYNYSRVFDYLIISEILPDLIGVCFAILAFSTTTFINYILVNKKAETFKERFICYKIYKNFKKFIEKNRDLRNTVKQIEKKLLIILSIWAVIEFAAGFFACGFGFEEEIGVFFSIVLLLNTIFGIIFALRFLSQTKTLAIAVENMKNGNLDINLDSTKFVFPLKDFARNLNECRDSIEKAVGEALKGERLKTELITNVSHDLKTPLTSIINYVSLLKLCNIEGEDENKYLDILDEKSTKLKRLIEDLTEASKASSGNIKMTVDTVNLNELALQAVGENNDVLENVGLEIVVSQKNEDLFVKADSQHTFRIFDNLFSNVKKYALSGTRVYVDVYKEGNYGVFSVKNISKDKLNINPDEITERFVRGDNSRTTEGSGLGLSIARSFTELQNGIFSIDIDGDLFKVTIKLPITNKPQIKPEAPLHTGNEFGIAREKTI